MNTIRPEFVEFIPASLSAGVLYISERYRTASHLCACGCGEKVVTPLSPANWRLIRHGNSVSLYPSIGNWNYVCRSHYWITRNRVMWADTMSSAEILQVQQQDRSDRERQVYQRNQQKLNPESAAENREHKSSRRTSPWWKRIAHWIKKLFS
ncbi:DUF6527 family protein [Acidihalobacter yilgarnensis]|uniref:DUF6527 family protein n=1 Tax=Acidihalobacter yilgarnensis TaxID=2819280 RepID=UPI0038991ED9